jgi:hypothetical protein
MFTRPAQRMLHALSAWLQRRTDWAASLAAQLDARIANGQNARLQSEPTAPFPGASPADWLARTQPQPPAHWLEHIRRASNGQLVEIHAQAQPEPQPASSGQPPNGAPRPVIAGDSEPVRIMHEWLSIPGELALQQTPAPAAEILHLPPDVARPVLRLAGEPGYPAPGSVTAAALPQAVASMAERPRPDNLSPITHTLKLREAPKLLITHGEAATTMPAATSPTKHEPDLPALSIPQHSPAAQPQLPAKPESELSVLPQPAAVPRWPDLLPLQPPFVLTANRKTEPASTRLPANSGVFDASGIISATNREALHLPSNHWPELPFPWMENDDGEVKLEDARQQHERRQRLDQEQRGSTWNT